MKTFFTLLALLASFVAVAQTLPVITASPTNTTVYPGNTATFTVTATGATGYQWLFNGTNIPGATSAALQVPNAQTANCGYYLALAKNATGWVPSQMAYLMLDYTYGGTQPTAGGVLPFSNTNDTYFAGDIEDYSSGYPTNGTVQIIAGPELDEMQPVLPIIHYRAPSFPNWFFNGYYNAAAGPSVSTIKPGQPFYYWVIASFTNGGAYIQPSTKMLLTAGTHGSAAPSCYGLKFPGFDQTYGYSPGLPDIDPEFDPSVTNKLCVVGESCTFSNSYFAYDDYGTPTAQWRKDGVPIPGATNNYYQILGGTSPPNSTFTITNVQASDVGIYDVVIYGNIWGLSSKVTLSVQTTNGQGVFQQPSLFGTNFICSLLGAASRNYQVQWSTNLTSWNNLTTLSNITGIVTFTNPVASTGMQFYRTFLLP